MKRAALAARRPPPDLPIDLADGAGIFGLVAGALSVALPYFVGLVVALSIFGAGVGVQRLWTRRGSGARHWWGRSVALGPILAGWVLFVAEPAPLDRYRGLWLGLGAVPLWWSVRRAPAFGGL